MVTTTSGRRASSIVSCSQPGKGNDHEFEISSPWLARPDTDICAPKTPQPEHPQAAQTAKKPAAKPTLASATKLKVNASFSRIVLAATTLQMASRRTSPGPFCDTCASAPLSASTMSRSYFVFSTHNVPDSCEAQETLPWTGRISECLSFVHYSFG